MGTNQTNPFVVPGGGLTVINVGMPSAPQQVAAPGQVQVVPGFGAIQGTQGADMYGSSFAAGAAGVSQPQISGSVLQCMADIASMMASVTMGLMDFVKQLLAKQGQEGQSGQTGNGGRPSEGASGSGRGDNTDETEESEGEDEVMGSRDLESALDVLQEDETFELLDVDKNGVLTSDELDYAELSDSAKSALKEKLDLDNKELRSFMDELQSLEKELSVTADASSESNPDKSLEGAKWHGISKNDFSAMADQIDEGDAESLKEIVQNNLVAYKDGKYEKDQEGFESHIEKQRENNPLKDDDAADVIDDLSGQFDELDVNQDGLLTAQELQGYVDSLEEDSPEREAAQAVIDTLKEDVGKFEKANGDTNTVRNTVSVNDLKEIENQIEDGQSLEEIADSIE